MMIRALVLLGVLPSVLCAFAPRARAQSFNVDMGASTHPLPSSTYGGAANQPGFWNSVDETSAPAYTVTLLDLNSQPTSATVRVRTDAFSTVTPVVYPDPAGFSADQAALFGDRLQWVNSFAQATVTVEFTGLAPGSYIVYGYAGGVFSEGSFYVSQCGSNAICMFFDGTFSQGSVWGQRCCQAANGTLTLGVQTCGSPLSEPAINAVQLVRRAFSCTEVSEPFCSGLAVGGACACPCGNCGQADRGCDNSFATGGGRLFTSGTASVSADTLVLRAEFLPPTSSALFYQGTGFVAGGFGTAYADGLRCVGGSAIRLGTRSATGGVVAFGAGQGSDPLVSAIGAIPPAGGTRYYQVWYRNAPAFCTPATVNLTNGFKLRWSP